MVWETTVSALCMTETKEKLKLALSSICILRTGFVSCFPCHSHSDIGNVYLLLRAATAGKAGKVWSLPRFWVTIRSYKTQLVKKIGVEYWTLPGSNLPWRPCYFCPKLQDKHCREYYDYDRGNKIQCPSFTFFASCNQKFFVSLKAIKSSGPQDFEELAYNKLSRPKWRQAPAFWRNILHFSTLC